MDASDLKAEALCWLRFVKRMPIIATEVGNWSADVLGMNNNVAMEVEVKVSKSDLKREFITKRSKHYLYGNNKGNFIPNYFYVFVTEELRETALEVVTAANPKYGILVYKPELFGKPGERLEVVKRAARLNDNPPSPKTIKASVLRMSSEVCNMHLAFLTINKAVSAAAHRASQDAARLGELKEDTLPEEAGDIPKPSLLVGQ